MEIHPQRAKSRAKTPDNRRNAHFPEQVLDSKGYFPAHLVIVLSR
jgi:hypothetical protein